MTAWRDGTILNDPDKRRAALLSFLLHLTLLLVIFYFASLPRPEPPPSFIVIDVGTPAFAEQTTNAATVESPAMSTPTPQVASAEVGDPQQSSAEPTLTSAPEVAPSTIQPPAPQAPPAAAPPEVAEVAPEPVITPPIPPVQASAPEPAQIPLAEVAATALPEIELEAIEIRPTLAAVSIPMPETQVVVAEARALTPAASASIVQSVTLSPSVVSSTVTESRSLEPNVAQAQVTSSVALTAPPTTVEVAQTRSLATPDVTSAVPEAVGLSASGASASVSGSRPLAPPAASAVVGRAVALDVAPTVAVAVARPLATPTVRADVAAEAFAAGTPGSGGQGDAVSTDVAATAESDRPAGGNASTSGQTGPPDPDATLDGRGLAAGPDGEGEGTGAPAPLRPPTFTEVRDRPINVLLDNHLGYPQLGLAEASMIVEMPVEGGITRLMASYDMQLPARVGPVRSAREYFVEMSQDARAVLVHDGGSPGAMIAIANATIPTLNAYSSGDLFARAGERSAPYNLYSQGSSLRAAVNRILPERLRLVADSIFRPTAAASQVTELSVSFGAYSSGFRYDAVTGRYRWIRAGEPANHPDGQMVLMQAVLVGEITARPIPDDAAGRLYIPLQMGRATLYLEGRAEAGYWDSVEGRGVVFSTLAGEIVDLSKLRTWVILAPGFDGRVEQ